MIEVDGLAKTYRVHKREAGAGAAFRSVFRRTYEAVHALTGISFRIEPGERVGFLGPNGAGKTTTLKILSGLLHPSSGRARVRGFDPAERKPDFLKSITLVMGQKQQLLWDLPPLDTYAMNRALYDIPRPAFDATLATLVELLDIGGLMNKPTRQLSLGERMKCELAAALLHQPKVLFLDEPTIGLDVSMQERIRQFIRQHNERFGSTVVLTSHYMEDVAALCPRVIVIDKGALVYDGDLRALARRVRPDRRLTLRLETVIDGTQRAHLERLGTVVTLLGADVVLSVPAARANEVVREVLASLPVVDLSIEDAPLEEVMRALFAQTSAERAAHPPGGSP